MKRFCSISKSKQNKLDTIVIDGVFSQLKDYLTRIKQKESKLIDFKTPEELKQIIPFELSDTQKSSSEEIVEYTQKIIDYSVHTPSHNFYNTLFGGFDERAIAADYIASSLNGCVYTYEIAPVFTLMEQEVTKKHAEVLRWDKHDFLFCPGGSYANFYGITTARHNKFPEYKTKGSKNLPQMKIVFSENGHYSFEKGAIMAGIGLENVVKVKCDKQGKMDVKELEKVLDEEKEAGNESIVVVSTLGTTVFGALDPVSEIDKVCKERGIWHHVDACLGSGVLFLDEYHRNEPGIKNIDSIAIDYHKVFNVPQQCTMFLTRHTNLLIQANSTKASYLFMPDKILYDASLDKGDKSFQCGQHIDIPKIWLYWKYHSTEGIRQQIVEVMENAKYLAKLVTEHPNFELIIEPEYNNVSFFYFPDRFLNRKKDSEFYEEIGKIAPQLKAEMVKKGTLMMAYQTLKFNDFKLPNFLRPSISVGKDKQDMEYLVNELHDIGRNL